jgi:hypothetical protein
MGWKEVLLYGISGNKRVGGTTKHTEYLTDKSGDRGTTFRYADGCLTIYQHQGGRVSGYHADAKGNILGQKFDKPEGAAGVKHPHHPEGQKAAVKQGKAVDLLGEVAIAWDRALRWNKLR